MAGCCGRRSAGVDDLATSRDLADVDILATSRDLIPPRSHDLQVQVVYPTVQTQFRAKHSS